MPTSPWLINRSKISSIVNLLWVSIPVEEVSLWKAKVANEPPFRLELLAYLNWNEPLLVIFYICKSKIKNPLLVWFMKPPKMVYEMVIDRNNFLLITLFHCQILWVLHENSREIECRMKKNITHNTKNYYIRTFIISSLIYYEWLWVILLTYAISVILYIHSKMSSVKVAVRVRPFNSRELGLNSNLIINMKDKTTCKFTVDMAHA